MILAPNALTTPVRFSEMTGVSLGQLNCNVLTRHINAISARAANFCGREFGLRIYPANSPWLGQGTGKTVFYLPFAPIKSLTTLIINNWTATVITVDNTTAVPLQGQNVYRTPDWDKIGKIYCPLGFTAWTAQWADLSQDANFDPLFRHHHLRLLRRGGCLIPQFGGVTNPDHNPTGDPSDLPADLEEAVVTEIETRLSRPVRGLLREKTPGGREMQYEANKDMGEFSPQAMSVFLGYRFPEAVFV